MNLSISVRYTLKNDCKFSPELTRHGPILVVQCSIEIAVVFGGTKIELAQED